MSTNRKFIIGIAVVGVLWGSQAQAQPDPLTEEKVSRIDAFVEGAMAELDVPGASIALIENGRIVHVRGFGFGRIGGESVSADTPFQTGSITKSFTSLAILLLAERGLLALDDLVVDHVPWFTTPDPSQSNQITVRHLMSHRSGFSTTTGNRNQGRGGADPRALEIAVKDLLDTRLQSKPGESFAYSNANYQVLGLLIETVSGDSYEQFVQTNILEQLEMNQAGFVPGQVTGVSAAEGHRYWFGRPRSFDGGAGRFTVAQGGLRAAANDLAKYLLVFLDHPAPLISAEYLATMLTPLADDPGPDYALGWYVQDFDGFRLVFHSGGNPGFESMIGFSPDKKFGFVVLANTFSGFGTRNVSALTRGVGDLVMDRPAPPLTPDTFSRISFLLLCTMPIGIVTLAFRFVSRLRARELRSIWSFGLGRVVLRVVTPSVLLFLLAYALYFVVPATNGAPISAVWLFNPDVALLLTIGAGLAAGWGVLRIVLWLMVGREVSALDRSG